MDEATPRQLELLKTVVEDYINIAKPVGSVEMVKAHNLKISPATVRNEMVRLIEKGLLTKTHSSSGRVPTSLGLRVYLNSLMEEEPLPVLTEVAIKQRLWNERFDLSKLLRKLTLVLSQQLNYLSFATTSEEHVFHAGAVNILNHPEFFDIEVTRAVLNLLDHESELLAIVGKASSPDPVHVLLGTELSNPNLKAVAVVFSTVESARAKVTFGLIGPDRLTYKKVMPHLKYFRSLLAEALKAS